MCPRMPSASAGTKLAKRNAVHSWIATSNRAEAKTLAASHVWAASSGEPVGVTAGLIAAAAKIAL